VPLGKVEGNVAERGLAEPEPIGVGLAKEPMASESWTVKVLVGSKVPVVEKESERPLPAQA